MALYFYLAYLRACLNFTLWAVRRCGCKLSFFEPACVKILQNSAAILQYFDLPARPGQNQKLTIFATKSKI
jgi:hypothetical protein